jgi:hypothetical protein
VIKRIKMDSKKVVLIVILSLLASKGWSESEYFCNTEHAISLFKSGKTYNKLDAHFLTQFIVRVDEKNQTLTLNGSHFGEGYEMALEVSSNGLLLFGKSNSASFVIDKSVSKGAEYRSSTTAVYVSGSVGTCIW